MMTVARYWESTINKTEILFSVFAIKFLASAIFFLDNGSTYKMNNGPNEKKKKAFVREKSNSENWVKSKHEYVDQA